jgi:hypothetical protein
MKRHSSHRIGISCVIGASRRLVANILTQSLPKKKAPASRQGNGDQTGQFPAHYPD